jgi:hypothetical protein
VQEACCRACAASRGSPGRSRAGRASRRKRHVTETPRLRYPRASGGAQWTQYAVGRPDAAAAKCSTRSSSASGRNSTRPAPGTRPSRRERHVVPQLVAQAARRVTRVRA